MKRGMSFRPNERVVIHPSDLDEVAAEQNVTWKIGDILLVRTGFLHWYKRASVKDQRTATMDASSFLGVHADSSSFEWYVYRLQK
jgi:hypothetical protein